MKLLSIFLILLIPISSYSLTVTPLHKGKRFTPKTDGIFISSKEWNAFEKKSRILNQKLQKTKEENEALDRKIQILIAQEKRYKELFNISDKMVHTAKDFGNECFKTLQKEKSGVAKSPMFWYGMGVLTVIIIAIGGAVTVYYVKR